MATNKKAPFYYLKSADGAPSMAATLVLVSFYVTTIVYILSAFDNLLHLDIKPFDPAAVSAYLIPILTLYGVRKHTEAKEQTARGATAEPPKPHVIQSGDEDQSE